MYILGFAFDVIISAHSPKRHKFQLNSESEFKIRLNFKLVLNLIIEVRIILLSETINIIGMKSNYKKSSRLGSPLIFKIFR